MENQTLVSGQAQASKASYKIVKIKAHNLQTEFLNYILSKWLRSLKYGNDYFNLINSDDYYKTYNKYILSVLVRPSVIIKFALLDKDVILGFSITEELQDTSEALHYVYVHRDQRRSGIMMALLPKNISTFTHITKDWLKIWNKKYNKTRFNPFL